MLKDERQINKWVKIRFFFYLLFLTLYLVPIVIVFIDGIENALQLSRRIIGLTGLTSLFINVFIPKLIYYNAFFIESGRPALYLIYALIIAFLRESIKNTGKTFITCFTRLLFFQQFMVSLKALILVIE